MLFDHIHAQNLYMGRPAPMKVSLDVQIQEARREIETRKRDYVRLIELGTMTDGAASSKIMVMEAIIESLEELRIKRINQGLG